MTAFEHILDHPLSADSSPMAGRTALIVGGGLSGEHGSIGFASAWMMFRDGARVVVADRDEAAAARTVDLIREHGGEADMVVGDVLSSTDSCRQILRDALDVAGTIDAVVTTVGRGDLDGILDVQRDLWDEILEVNLTSAWQLIQAAAEILPRGSSIVTTSSGAAAGRGPGTPYAVAKAGLEQLTIGAAASLAPKGIRVNAVRVGTIWSTFASRAFDEQLRALRSSSVALRQEGDVWDIAAAISFLSGERARWITGQVLAVDGGGPTPAPPGHIGNEEDK